MMTRRDVLQMAAGAAAAGSFSAAAAAAVGAGERSPAVGAAPARTPALTVRRSGERGHFDFGWLDTRHTFSFGSYFDPRFMGFRALRVINEDRVRQGEGFPTHPHRDMEIITYVLEGALEHKDSMGTGSVIRPGDVQRMSAGTGVTHSEYNHSKSEVVHFLQIWIVPEANGHAPGYEQRTFPAEEKRGKLRLVASRTGEAGSIRVAQDVRLYASLLDPGEEVALDLEGPANAESRPTSKDGRHAWIQVLRGAITVNGARLEAGDGASASGGGALALRGEESAEILVFDLA